MEGLKLVPPKQAGGSVEGSDESKGLPQANGRGPSSCPHDYHARSSGRADCLQMIAGIFESRAATAIDWLRADITDSEQMCPMTAVSDIERTVAVACDAAVRPPPLPGREWKREAASKRRVSQPECFEACAMPRSVHRRAVSVQVAV